MYVQVCMCIFILYVCVIPTAPICLDMQLFFAFMLYACK